MFHTLSSLRKGILKAGHTVGEYDPIDLVTSIGTFGLASGVLYRDGVEMTKKDIKELKKKLGWSDAYIE